MALNLNGKTVTVAKELAFEGTTVTAAIDVSDYDSMSATILQFDADSVNANGQAKIYCQGSIDGLKWFDMPVDIQMKDAIDASNSTANPIPNPVTNKRNFNETGFAGDFNKSIGIFKHLPFPLIRFHTQKGFASPATPGEWPLTVRLTLKQRKPAQ